MTVHILVTRERHCIAAFCLGFCSDVITLASRYGDVTVNILAISKLILSVYFTIEIYLFVVNVILSLI